ncbi:glycosyltransferase [Escherichia coli]
MEYHYCQATGKCWLGNALNNGLAHCSFDIVARMDSDDICLPERFQTNTSFF